MKRETTKNLAPPADVDPETHQNILHDGVASNYMISGLSNIINAYSEYQTIEVGAGPTKINIIDDRHVTILIGKTLITLDNGTIMIMLDKNTHFLQLGRP